MAQRIIDIDSGTAMVVTDLHGSWEAYTRLRDSFLERHERGEIQRLIFCGDLIHSEGIDEHDASLDIIMDIMTLQAWMGKQTIIMLLGNHELPHIYGLTLAKGSVEYTPRFEASIARLDQRYKSPFKRKDIIQFFAGLPFFVRTKAGVMLTHAGAVVDVATVKQVESLAAYDHQTVIESADVELKKFDVASLQRGYSHFTGISYDEQVKHYLSVNSPDDPRYNHLLRVLFLSGQSADFDLLWNVMFSQNELDIGEAAYMKHLRNFLLAFSDAGTYEQRVLVSGHISAKDGYTEIGKQQLRIASHTHAFPRKSARYLILDCEKSVSSAAELMMKLQFVVAEAHPQPAVSLVPTKSA
jgi:hypothetical protein